MKRRLLVSSAVVASILVLSGAAVVAARPDLLDHLRYQFTSDNIGAPDSTSALPPITTGLTPIRIAVAGDVGTGGDAEYQTAAAMDDLEANSEYAGGVARRQRVPQRRSRPAQRSGVQPVRPGS